jgi:hypothetical protein
LVTHACVEDPANDQIALIRHAERLTDAGPEPLPDQAVLTLRCGSVAPGDD